MEPISINLWTSTQLKLPDEDMIHAQQTFDRRKEGVVVDPDSPGEIPMRQFLFARRMVGIVSKRHSPPITLTSKQLLSKMFNALLKGVKNTGLEKVSGYLEIEDLENHLEFRMQEAVRLMQQAMPGKIPPKGVQTREEFEGLARIIKHRTNFRDFYVPGENTEAIQKNIQKNINALSLPESPNTVTLNDGTTCFAMPGGSDEHATAYEFRKKEDRYFFVIHNRGEGCNDPRLHGSISCIDPASGKEYCKTIVTIEVSKEALQNPALLKNLIKGLSSSDPYYSYDSIHYYLVRAGQGTLVKSDAELLLEKLHAQLKNPLVSLANKEKIQAQMMELIALDPSFNSTQLYGTCAESNTASLEKTMAPPQTRWALKLSTSTVLIEQASKTPFARRLRTRSKILVTHPAPKIIELSKAQSDHFRKKLATPKASPKTLTEVSSQAERLLETVTPNLSDEQIKEHALTVMANFILSFGIEPDMLDDEELTLIGTEAAYRDDAITTLIDFRMQCTELLKVLGEGSEEYRKTALILDAITQFLELKEEASFGEAREVERQVREALQEMHFDKCKDLQAQLRMIKKAVKALNKPLEMLKGLLKGDPKFTFHFWMMLRLRRAQIQEALEKIPDSRQREKEPLQKQLDAIQLLANIHLRLLLDEQIEKGDHDTEGRLVGPGQVLSTEGAILKKGEFIEGRLVRGILSDEDGNRWEGRFNAQERLTGRGRLTKKNGDILEGIFNDGALAIPQQISF